MEEEEEIKGHMQENTASFLTCPPFAQSWMFRQVHSLPDVHPVGHKLKTHPLDPSPSDVTEGSCCREQLEERWKAMYQNKYINMQMVNGADLTLAESMWIMQKEEQIWFLKRCFPPSLHSLLGGLKSHRFFPWIAQTCLVDSEWHRLENPKEISWGLQTRIFCQKSNLFQWGRLTLMPGRKCEGSMRYE